jgi:hypothetical protein
VQRPPELPEAVPTADENTVLKIGDMLEDRSSNVIADSLDNSILTRYEFTLP